MATLAAYLGEETPATHEGILAAAKALPTPEIYNVLRNAEPLGDPAQYRIPSNMRRHYERLPRFPKGYLVLGDAMCSFNPIYGQGMSVAALASAALHTCLEQGEDGLAARYFQRAAEIIDVPWNTAVGSDLRFPEVEGPRTAMTRFINWYVSKLHIAAQHDAEVSVAFLKVVNMLEAPPLILRPNIALRVARGNLRNLALLRPRGASETRTSAWDLPRSGSK